jgi:hypothetical protein
MGEDPQNQIAPLHDVCPSHFETILWPLPICNGTDATFFDPGPTLVFVSCSDGHVTIAHMDSPDGLSVRQTLETSPRSRTMALDHNSPIHQLFSGR